MDAGLADAGLVGSIRERIRPADLRLRRRTSDKCVSSGR